MDISEVVDLTDHPRGGVHLSSVISYMNIQMEKFLAKDLSEADFHRFKIGYSWEAAFLSGGILIDTVNHHEHTIPQVRFEEDGIRMTSDGVDFPCRRVIETKATWYGIDRDILSPVFSHYHWQGKAYAKAAGLKRVLYPFAFMNGDYRKSRGPRFRAWECTYSTAELDKNWSMILRNRDAMLKAGERS